LGEGSLGVFGPTLDGKGTAYVIIQRYGAKKMDQMVNINTYAHAEEPNQIAKELGCEGIHGITRDKDIVKRVIDDAKRRLSNENWPQKYRDMFDSVEGIRILPVHMHPTQEETMNNLVPGSDDLPFIGIGDALHALPPWSGMSGNYALVDAADLASGLLIEQQQQQHKSGWTPSSIATMLRGQEKKFLQRTEDRREHGIRTGIFMNDYMSSTAINNFDILSLFLGKKFQWNDPEAIIVSTFLRSLTLLNRWDDYGVPISKVEQESK